MHEKPERAWYNPVLRHPTTWDPRFWALVGLILGILALWLGELLAEAHDDTLSEVVNELGIALIVFACLTFSFEGTVRHHLDQQYKSTFDRLGEGFFSNKVFPIFKKLLPRLYISRHNAKLMAHICTHEDEPEYVTVSMELSYVVSNDTSETEDVPILIESEKPAHHIAYQPYCELFIGGTPVNLDDRHSSTDWSDRWECAKTLPAKATDSVVAKWIFIGHRRDQYNFRAAYITEDMRLVVSYAPEYEVQCSMPGPVENVLREDLDKVQMTGSPRHREWYTTDSSMPGQTFNIQWRPAAVVRARSPEPNQEYETESVDGGPSAPPKGAVTEDNPT